MPASVPPKPKCWLVKTEPSVYSIQDLARDGRTAWNGVRNYQARNFMRDEMRVGDLVLVYHSNEPPLGVAGIARVASGPYADPTQFDPKSDYYDEKATKEEPRWQLVDLEHVETFERVLPLDVLKKHAKRLDGLMLLRRGVRFSVQPVLLKHFDFIVELARSV